jgi:hypothetical protein
MTLVVGSQDTRTVLHRAMAGARTGARRTVH